jgi:hypothetical protein
MSTDVSKRLATNSIYSLFLETKDESKITFHHVLQRVNVLLQERLAYALFEKKKGRFKLYYPFLNDPIGAPKLAEFYRNRFGSSENPSDTNDDLKDYLFQILESNYYLLCIRVLPLTHQNTERFQFVKLKTEDNDRNKLEEIRGKVRLYEEEGQGFDIDHDDNGSDDGGAQRAVIIRYVLGKVFLDEEPTAKNVGFRKISENFVGYEKAIKKSIDNLKRNKRYLHKHLSEDGSGYWYQDSKYAYDEKEDRRCVLEERELENFNKNMNGLKGALEISYLKVANSINRLLFVDEEVSSLPRLVNFLFFQSRGLFEEEGRRKGAYPFALKISVPESQKRDFECYFDTLSSLGKTKFAKKYLSYRDAFSNGNDWLHSWISWADKEFWRVIKSKDESSAKIIEILSKDFGEMRSIIDPVFFSNYTFYPFPFEKSGLERVLDKVESHPNEASKEFLKKEGLYEDCLRIVVLYYLVFGMMPEHQRKSFSKGRRDKYMEPEDLALSVVPVSVQGVTYGCVAHYASLGDSIRLQNLNWQRNFNLYHNIDRRFIRELRKQLERLFLRHIRENIEINIVYLLLHSDKDKKNITLAQVNLYLNNNLAKLSGFIPFGSPKLSLQTEKGEGNIVLFEYPDISYYLRVDIDTNQYFLKFFDHTSRMKEKVDDAVESGVNAALTAVRIWEAYEDDSNKVPTQ